MTRIVYEVTRAAGYQYFLPEKPEDRKKLRMCCKPRAEEWEPIPVYIQMPFFEAGDLYNYDRGYLILSPKAWQALEGGGFLEKEVAEVLPLGYDGQTYGVVNVLMCINCLDHEKTIWRPEFGGKIIDKPAFHPSRLPSPGLFQIPETTSIYVLIDDTEQFDFITKVEIERLKGFQFTRLWDDETGIVNPPDDESSG